MFLKARKKRVLIARLLLRPWLGYKHSDSTTLAQQPKSFRRLVWDIILMTRVCKCFRTGLRGFSCFQLLEKDCRGIEDRKSVACLFDSKEFSVSKDHFPYSAIQITRKLPNWRTPSDIKHLQNYLHVLESFRSYSPTLRRLLAKVIRFERFGRRRVIIKKGQSANSFYFIYFGLVAITDDEDGSRAFVDAAPTLLRKGASFGEIALLRGTKRNATVVCMSETELLVVDRKDFFAYDLDRELEREVRNRYDYLRTVDIFETMPDTSIQKMANFCKVEKFLYGQVITSDLAETASMIFITQGMCEVLRLIDLSSCTTYHKWLARQLHLPRRKQYTKGKHPGDSEAARINQFKSTAWKSFTGKQLNQLKAYYARPVKQQRGKHEKKSSLFRKSHKNFVLSVDAIDKRNSSQMFGHQNEEREVVQKVVSGAMRTQSTYHTSYGEMPTSVAATVYIRIDELYKGDYIANLQDDRSIVLVSQGAEVIRLRKDKLEECADEATIIKLCKIKTTYPSDEELCQMFLQQNSWEMFKKDLMDFVLKPKQMKLASPPIPVPVEEISDSWYVNQAGILDLTPIRFQRERPPVKYSYIPVHLGRAEQPKSLPKIQPRLIHGITVLRPSLNGLF